ncbi:biliverdin-producing heme oxygenase [Rhizobium sp. EC-SD404]|uniref:biliverdin-producing heme oxygenase n=1 Tax=Rhizobium sp. EC-SD404 TaxID=2038389 RepID=UPI00125A8549|nr:biliverdin-producing heme oxygenase [Rhizobium sp. EC-SD404]VVT22431.1 putative Heme oxygenase [Rhizobium sp. EC-SD404]
MTLLATLSATATSSAGEVAPESLSRQLRHHTARAHKQTERAAGLNARSIDRRSLVRFFEKMHGFQSAHERWLLACGIDQAFLAARQRADLMRTDLMRLGGDEEPVAYDIVMPTPSTEEGYGILYVLEGSRAGGRYIDQWACGNDWYPPEGLSSLQSEDGEALWRETQAALDALPQRMKPKVLASADATFQRLEGWFARQKP